MALYEIIASALVILGAALIGINAISLWLCRGPISRANVLGLTVGVALPILVAAQLVVQWGENGFVARDFIWALLTIAALWIVAPVASFYLGRSLYGREVDDAAHKVSGEGGSEPSRV